MNQSEWTRRAFMYTAASAGAAATFGRIPSASAAEGDALRIWANPGVHKVGAKDWSAMASQAGVEIAATAKSARADESIQKMVVGDGNKLFDAVTDNGGGMEDALASQKAIVPLDTSRIPNWKNILPVYREGGLAADTIRFEGKVYSTPMISNADSMAYDFKALGFHPDSWGVMFDAQFKGRVALQNDFGPTLTNMGIYLKETGKIDIENPSSMKPDEVKAVCQFLIEWKKKGQFRTFWDGFQNGVGILASGEVLMSSCWEPIQIVANKKAGDTADIRYGTMKEGHQTWNNMIMLTRGGLERGMDEQYYKLANVYLSPWFGSRTLSGLGFAPQMTGVDEYIKANPTDFPADVQERVLDILTRKNARFAVKGNSWQNVFPEHIRAYQDWWARLQAA
ncbi:MAG: putative spermidine/putrescine transport system substrate-binding protein [Alphaproteobacteria bacterium]|jgi:putative spermidine/putrescine transport system substrate-binding protein